jgi:TolB protein
VRALRAAVVVVLAGTLVGLALVSGGAASGGRNGSIAFLRQSSGPPFSSRLFVINPGGSELRPVTPAGTKVFVYAWSPDGRQIAYIDQKTLSLWLVRPDGTGRRLLLASSKLAAASVSWSPDGKNIAIASPGPSSHYIGCPSMALYVVAVDGAAPRRLAAGHPACWDVAWSPRGDEIAFSGGGIWVVRPDGTGLRQISPKGVTPEWSADGTQLAFNVLVRLNGRPSRYSSFAAVDLDGSHYHLVTTHAYTEYGQAWSPTTKRILYGGRNGSGVYAIGPDGRHNHQITPDAPPETEWPAFDWSPSGGAIVYSAGTDNDSDLYVISADGRNKVQLTNTPDFDTDPTWTART